MFNGWELLISINNASLALYSTIPELLLTGITSKIFRRLPLLVLEFLIGTEASKLSKGIFSNSTT